MKAKSSIPYVSYSGLTREQYTDCLQADRNPKTGKRNRQSHVTKLERKSRETNWYKFMITGASGNLQQVLRKLNVSSQFHASLEKKILDIECQMLNQLAADYEAFKATELFERDKLQEF